MFSSMLARQHLGRVLQPLSSATRSAVRASPQVLSFLYLSVCVCVFDHCMQSEFEVEIYVEGFNISSQSKQVLPLGG